MIYFLIILLQVDFIPPMTPTPWSPPTAEPTVEEIVVDSADLIATAQATEFAFEADGDQITYNSQPLLPEIDSAESWQLFAYARWLFSPSGFAIFGPFSPILIPLGVLLSFAFISLFVYFWENVVVTILKLVSFIINSVLRIFGR